MLNVLEGMREAGVKKLVFSSSAATYGVPPVDVVPEDVQPMVPINPYGQTKLFGEWMARACEEPYGIRFCGLATSTWPVVARWSSRTRQS